MLKADVCPIEAYNFVDVIASHGFSVHRLFLLTRTPNSLREAMQVNSTGAWLHINAIE